MTTTISQRKQIGSRIRKYRTRSGLGICVAAQKIGVTRQTLYNWEVGNKSITVENLHKLSRVLNVPVGAFFDRKTA